MKWTSIFKFLTLPLLVAAPVLAQAYTVIINGTSFETSRPPTVDVDYLSTGVRVTIAGVDITAASSGSSSSSSSSDSSSNCESSSRSTWGSGDCSDDSSSDDSSSDDTTTVTTTTDANDYSTGECSNTDRVACHGYDWGPAGLGSFWSTAHAVPAGKVWAVPFTVRTSGSGPYGFISTSRQSGQDAPDYGIRMWFSETPGGKRVKAEAACGKVSSATGGVRWIQAADKFGYCNLPSTEKKTYYFNVALCNSSDSDVECLNSSSKFNPNEYYIRFSATSY